MKGIPPEDQAFYAQQEEADALFDQAEDLAALALEHPRREERRRLLTEAAEVCRLAWEAKGRAEDAR